MNRGAREAPAAPAALQDGADGSAVPVQRFLGCLAEDNYFFPVSPSRQLDEQKMSQKISPGERSAKGINISKQNTTTSSSPTHGSVQMKRFTHPSCPSSLSFHSFSALFGCFRQRQARCPDLQVVVLQPRFDFLEVSVHPFDVVLDGLDRLLHAPKLSAFLPGRTKEFFHLLTKET